MSQHLRSETFLRPEDYTDWEIAPPSYDPQSWGSLDLNEHYFTPMNHLKQLSQYEWFVSSIHTGQCLRWIAGGNVGLPLDTT